MQKADFLTRFIFPNPSFKEFVSDWLEESSVEELKQIEITYITSPEKKRPARKKTGRSHRPFWQWVIDQEHLHIAQLRDYLQLPPRAFKEIRVDSIVLQAGVTKHNEI